MSAQADASNDMAIRKDYTIDVLRLLEAMKKDIEGCRWFGNIAIGLKQDDIIMTIEKIRASMPREMKDAATLTRETERIMSAADEEAKAIQDQAIEQAQRIINEAEQKSKAILDGAKAQQDQMISEDEILRIAKAQSEEIRSVADKDSREMRRGADKYAMDVLGNLENVVGKVLASVERGRHELEEQTSEAKAVVEVKRDRVKV